MKAKKLGLIVILGIACALAIGGITYMSKKKAEDEKYKKVENFHNELLGENVYIFSPEDDPEEVNKKLNYIYGMQETNQFCSDRYSVYFMPGEYDESIEVNVGYYTQVAGLGLLPTDTKIEKLQCLARWLSDDPSNNNATCNFWRGVENLEIQSNTVWAVSQATFMRRVQVDGALFLHDDYGWASGGFLSDSNVELMIDSGSQQQWLSRNNDYKTWMGENWNMVFVGDAEGSAPKGTWPGKAYTTVETTPVVKEKPFLFYDEEEGFSVFVPSLRKDSTSITWEDGVEGDGEIISLKEFYIANPETDTAETLNAALLEGKHLFFTPGIYELDEAVKVTNANTVVLGTGLASLVSTNGNACMEVADEDGIFIAGLLFDAGEKEATNLMVVGNENADKNHAANPICLSDVFFRVGGATPDYAAKADTCVTIYSNDIIGDNFWVWRADHGDNVAWDLNTARNGIVVHGDRATFYALMVEHFMEYQTLIYGEEARVYMYQSEIPYDVPSQDVWMSRDGTRYGYSSFYVDDNVEKFLAYGLGIYLYNRDAAVILESVMEVPKKEGIEIHNVCSVMITGNPGIKHVINDEGNSAATAGKRSIICEYRGGMIK